MYKERDKTDRGSFKNLTQKESENQDNFSNFLT